MFGLVGVLLVGLARGDCLANSTLTALGFTPLAPYAPSSNNTYCTDLLKTSQSCANISQIVDVVNAQKSAALRAETANFTTALSNATSAMSDFRNLCSSTFVSANLNKKVNNIVITQAMIDNCASLSNMSAQFGNITSSANLTNQIASCVSSVYTTMNGAYCLFISSSATTYVTTSGTNLQVTASADVPAPAVNPCLPLIFSTCYLNSVAAFLDQFTGTTTANAALTSTCGTMSTLASCTTDNNACAASKTAMFKQFFAPTGSKFGSSLSTTYGASIVSVRNYAVTAQRLLASATSLTSSYDVSASGFNVYSTATGLNTNSTSKGASLYGLGFLLMLTALFLN